jgi:LmbE family N-acetylglucosaminyl deacetylase
MPKTLLAIGAHYDDCVFGIPGILVQALARHYRVVILSIIGDYSNWAPVKGRDKKFVDAVTEISREYGAEMRFLKYASHRFDVDLETKRSVAEVVADVQPDVAFMMWPNDHHHDHEVASVLGKVALQHGDRLVENRRFHAPRAIYLYDNGPRHTIGFEPNTFVDVTAVWTQALDWLGRFMAVVANRPFDRAQPDGAMRAKEVLASYRGQACGVKYAEAVWAAYHQPRDVL